MITSVFIRVYPWFQTISRGVIASALVLTTACCRNTTRSVPDSMALGATSRAQAWAEPMDEAGLPNLYKVSDDLYRGAQPSSKGFDRLGAMKIKTVMNLRADDNDRQRVEHMPFAYAFMPMGHWSVRDEDVVRFLRLATDETQTPVFIHCEHGADRTGVLCAMYRVVVQDWPKEHAIAEMTRGGMGFHVLCGGLVEYVRKADVPSLRQQAGLKP